MNKFIKVDTTFGLKTISIESIALMENWMMGSKITMKEKDENGKQIVITTHITVPMLNYMISEAQKAQ